MVGYKSFDSYNTHFSRSGPQQQAYGGPPTVHQAPSYGYGMSGSSYGNLVPQQQQSTGPAAYEQMAARKSDTSPRAIAQQQMQMRGQMQQQPQAMQPQAAEGFIPPPYPGMGLAAMQPRENFTRGPSTMSQGIQQTQPQRMMGPGFYQQQPYGQQPYGGPQYLQSNGQMLGEFLQDPRMAMQNGVSCQDIAQHIRFCGRCQKLYKRNRKQGMVIIGLVFVIIMLLMKING